MTDEGMTTRDILLEIKATQVKQGEKLDRIENQTIKTNGRVTATEILVASHTQTLQSHSKKLSEIKIVLAKYAAIITFVTSIVAFLANKYL